MAKVDENRRKLLEYLSDPENEFLNRSKLSVEVLGYSDTTTLYSYFSPAELDEIEAESFEIRKKRSSRQQSQVYTTLHNQALKGDVVAAKEWLNRVAGKVKESVDINARITKESLSDDELSVIASGRK